jgi:uncharacterized membrane protein HdeD (DUF308 family)
MAPSILKSIHKAVTYWWLFLLSGILLIAIGLWVFRSPAAAYLSLLAILIIFFGVMVLANPAFGVANIIVWTGLAFIMAGIFRCYISLKLRSLKKSL